MKVNEDSPHSEHIKVLEALSSNLKSEVSRGLKLLDSCVSQIAQAKWILTNVDESLSGFSKGCPVCGILSDREKQIVKSANKEKHLSPNPVSPRRGLDSEFTAVNKTTPPKPTNNQPQRVASSVVPAVKAPYRIGPRSKTRPNEPIASTSIYDPLPTPPKQKDALTCSKLPKRLSIVISQTVVRVNLTDVKPYLHGHLAILNLNNLIGFESPVTFIPQDLVFKPKITHFKISKPKPAGPASRKFLESLHKFKSQDKPKVNETSSKTSLHVFSSSDDENPIKLSAPPAKKKRSSDSGSEYDYNFSKSAPITNATSGGTSIKKKRSKIVGTHSHLGLKKRPRHHLSSDSDEDYQYKKKKSSKSIFKKKMDTSSESDFSDDSDDYDRKKKKKVKRKDSTDKEKEKRTSSSSKPHGSKSSSGVTSIRIIETHKMTEDKKSNSSSSKTEAQRRESSASRGSTTGSFTKSDAGRDATAKSDNHSSMKTSYKPGPASRKFNVNEPPATTTILSGTKIMPVSKENDIEAVIAEKAKNPENVENASNGMKQQGKVTPKSTGVDPFAMLKQKLNEESATAAAEGSGADSVKKKLGVTGFMSMIKNNPSAKAALLAKLSLMKNKVPASKETETEVAMPKSSQSPLPTRASECLEKANGDATKVNVLEEEKGIELGDDVIGKCFGDIGGDNEVEVDTDSTVKTPIRFSLSPIPPPTLQDCVSPTALDKFVKEPTEPERTLTTTVKKIQILLLKLSNDVFEDAALLNSQDNINNLFGPCLTARSSEIETQRSDLQEGLWYFVKGQTIGKAVCSDTITEFEWNQCSAEELNEIYIRLESCTDS